MPKRALFHTRLGVVSRSKGQDALKLAAYGLCGRLKSVDGRRSYSFTRKRGEHVGHAMLLPEGAPSWASDPGELWRRAELAEKRIDAQPARALEFNLPRQVPAHLRLACAQYALAPLVTAGMALQLDLHCPLAADGKEQPHAHVLGTMRRFEDGEFSAKKNRAWNAAFQKNRGRAVRGLIASRLNEFCREHGIDCYVDPRSNRELGLDAPEPDVPRSAWAAYKQDPAHPPDCVREVLALRAKRRELRSAEAALAAAEAEAAEAYRMLAPGPDAWERLRAAWQADRAAARERDRVAFATAAHEQREAHERQWEVLRTRHAAERDRAYRRLPRGLVRNLTLAALRAGHQAERRRLKIEQAAERARPLPVTRAELPSWEDWLAARAAAEDHDARELVERAAKRNERERRISPQAAADRFVARELQRVERVLGGGPRGETDADVLTQAAQARITARRDKATAEAAAAREKAKAKWRAIGILGRLGGQGHSEWRRLAAAAAAAKVNADRIGASYRQDLRDARAAAMRAAAANAEVRRVWEQSDEVRRAREEREALYVVRAAISHGDEATIAAALGGDVPGALRAAAEWRRRAEQAAEDRPEPPVIEATPEPSAAPAYAPPAPRPPWERSRRQREEDEKRKGGSPG